MTCATSPSSTANSVAQLLALLRAVGLEHIDGAYDKIIHKLAEPDYPLALLPPYEGGTEAAYRQYKAELEAKWPAWLPSR